MYSHTPHLRRYVQHINMPDACRGLGVATFDGASVFWFDSLDSLLHPPESPKLIDAIPVAHGAVYDWYVGSARYGNPRTLTLAENSRFDDRQLFDRATTWPTDGRRSHVVATERVIVEGPTAPGMVKAIFVMARKPGLTVQEFQERWCDHHGQLVAQLPGLKRYVQNHAIPAAYGLRPMTHDGFSELWFDDVVALQTAVASREGQAVTKDGETLFAEPLGLVIAREQVQKELG
jgi:uncharacterized protein (TIGR02118 family)